MNSESQFHVRQFIAATPGLSATRWLAHVLASHPDVFVAHGHFPLDSVIRGDFQQEKKNGDMESLTTGTAMAHYYQVRTIHQVFADYAGIKRGARAYGNIHSYTLDALMRRRENPRDLDSVSVVNVLRHPVPYIDSHCSLVRSAETHVDLYRHYVQNLFHQALREFPELFLMDCFDYREFLAFAISCLSVCHMARDFQHRGFQHFKMEKLTSEAGTLKEFCETLTGLKYPLAQLASFIEKGPINRHRKGNVSTDPRLIYSSWPLWKQDMAIVMIPKGVLNKFEEEGYDVEMLRGNLITQQTQDPNIGVSSLADRLEAMDHDHPLLAALKRRPQTEGQIGKENRGRAHIIRLWRGLGRLLGIRETTRRYDIKPRSAEPN